MTTRQQQYVAHLEDPPVAQSLVGDVRWAWLWLILRLYVGWQWLEAGWGKIGAPAWTGENAGAIIGDAQCMVKFVDSKGA